MSIILLYYIIIISVHKCCAAAEDVLVDDDDDDSVYCTYWLPLYSIIMLTGLVVAVRSSCCE